MVLAQKSPLLSSSSCRLPAQRPSGRRPRAYGARAFLSNEEVQAEVQAPRETLPASASASRSRILPLMSELVLNQAIVTRFEQLAGRSAMVGFGVAAALELLLPSSSGVFGTWGAGDNTLAEPVACLGMFLLCCSVGLAASTRRRPAMRYRLLEPVIASLTGRSRSLAGVSNRNVDRVVDFVVDSVFTRPFMRAHFSDDDDMYI